MGTARTKADSPPFKFYLGRNGGWQPLEGEDTPVGEAREEGGKAREAFNSFLTVGLRTRNLVVLAGSGTSRGEPGGPSMDTLWNHCVYKNPTAAKEKREHTAEAKEVITWLDYQPGEGKENIEELLSLCEAGLELAHENDSEHLSRFVTNSKRTILRECSTFLDQSGDAKLDAHETFLRRLSRRGTRDPRLKLFTTNYDLCFETAAGRQGLVVIDGFSFSQPRRFDPRFFQYDIVRRTPATGEPGSPLAGVFQLFKLHGSVNWERRKDQWGNEVRIVESPCPEDACLIYPARGKYQQSYAQPYLELMSQYAASLREPDTCLVVIGFGFNDDHLSEQVLASVETNPHLRLIVVAPSAEQDASTGNEYWKALFEQTQNGADVMLVNGDFVQFATAVPNLCALTPADHLAKSIKALAGGQ